MPTRREDTERTLLFVDILGFAELTRQQEVRAKDWGPDDEGFSGWSTAEMANRFERFNNVLDRCVRDEARDGGIHAMLFSDCAFLIFENSLLAATVAVALMRDFIQERVPVRKGMGKSTFYIRSSESGLLFGCVRLLVRERSASTAATPRWSRCRHACDATGYLSTPRTTPSGWLRAWAHSRPSGRRRSRRARARVHAGP